MEEIKLQPTPTPPVAPQAAPKLDPAVSTLNKMPSQIPPSKFKKFLPFILIILIVSAGIFSGLVFSSRSKSSQLASRGIDEENLTPEQKQSFNQTFRDEAEGTIEKNAEMDKYAQGTHKLIRPGGESQTAYLTSSTLDLDEFNGKKVKVFGETFGSSQVGWLMDVGKVEVLK